MVEDPRGYRLAAVRDARSRHERGKRAELAAAVGDSRGAATRLETATACAKEAQTRLAEAIVARDALLAAGSTPARLALAERFIGRRRSVVEARRGEALRAQTALDETEGKVDAGRRLLARARADREVIDRHFARWREARQKLAQRRDD